ncbi:DUF72 domain-containing protein [Bacteroidota bacterium]
MTTDSSVDERLARSKAFDFRTIHPNVRFGTASDRYAGWIGQIYGQQWSEKTTNRTKKLGTRSFRESLVPTESVHEYFQHYSVLELDFTFYRPLVQSGGAPLSNYRVLERYLEHSPPDASFLVKAPQIYCSPYIPGIGDNSSYLDAQAYLRSFHEPLVALLGDQLAGILFEQGYQPVKETPPEAIFVERLDHFFDQVGPGPQVHLEVRSPHLLSPLYFDWLETKGLGHVYSHWTWLPSIKSQWQKCGRFTAANATAVVRLLTPRRMKYADAYVLAHPFDRAVPELSSTRSAREMVDETVALAFKAIEASVTVDVIANNRAWGNAPALSVELAGRLLEFERRSRQD